MRKNRPYNDRLYEMRSQKDIMMASHRGSIGVAIVDNTLESFDLALRQGAAILELDVAMTVDDKLYVIHDDMEYRLLKTQKNVQAMTSSEVAQHRYYTLNNTCTEKSVSTLDEVLEHLKDRCLINVDRSWAHPDEWKKWRLIFETVERHNMEDQVILKSSTEEKYLRFFAELEKPYLYMPMAKDPALLEPFLQADINLVAVEILFADSASPMADPALYERLHGMGIYTWGNAITLGGEHILAGGHDDNTALLGDPDFGWGWFAENCFDIVQTDWLLPMGDYYTRKGYTVR